METCYMSLHNSICIEAQKLFLSGNIQNAIDLLLNELKKGINIEYLRLISHYYFYLSRYNKSLFYLKILLSIDENNIDVLSNIVACYAYLAQYEECIKYCNKILSINPNHINAFKGLAHAFCSLGKIKEAQNAGNNALLLRDIDVTSNFKENGIYEYEDVQKILVLAHKKKYVCSFSLFGNNPRYLRGAIYNIIVGKELFPNWIMRFYVDNTVPHEVKDVLLGLDAEVIEQKDCKINDIKLFWRFLVASDPDVGYFMVRDCDSAFSLREAIIVNEWLDSGKLFHVIRDHLWHTDLILAGLWGGVACIIPDIKHMIDKFLIKEKGNSGHNDQKFLGKYIWPIIKKSCIIHDRYFDAFSPNRPPMKYFRTKDDHIGANRFVTDNDWQEKCLAPWIRELPCLSIQKKITINVAELFNNSSLKTDICGKYKKIMPIEINKNPNN